MEPVDLQRKEIDDKETILIFNPLKEDFQGKYDRKELPEYLIPSQENISLKCAPAKCIGNQIVDIYKATKDKNYPRERAKSLVFPND